MDDSLHKMEYTFNFVLCKKNTSFEDILLNNYHQYNILKTILINI